MEAVGRNFTELAEKNEINMAKIEFDEGEHKYTVEGQEVPISATAVKKKVFAEKEFDALGVISKYLHKWRSNSSSKYHHVVRGKTDEEAAKTLLDLWGSANVLGTKLHFRLEGHLNGTDVPDDGKTDVEWRVLKTFADELFKADKSKPLRTELSVCWRDEETGRFSCAGQIDLLALNEDGEYVMIDLKRTDKNLEEDERTFGYADPNGPMAGFGVNDFHKYSFQQSLYCVMLEQCAGIVVAPNERYLLQAHPNLKTAKKIRCACYDEQAKAALRALGKDSVSSQVGKKRSLDVA